MKINMGGTHIVIPRITPEDIKEMMQDKSFLKILAMSTILYRNFKE